MAQDLDVRSLHACFSRLMRQPFQVSVWWRFSQAKGAAACSTLPQQVKLPMCLEVGRWGMASWASSCSYMNPGLQRIWDGSQLPLCIVLGRHVVSIPPSLHHCHHPTGEDKRVALWQTTGSWTLHKSVQPLHKTTFHSAVHCPWASAGLGGSPSLVLASGGAWERRTRVPLYGKLCDQHSW